MRQRVLATIRTVYDLPPAVLMISCTVLTWLCYFVLPLAAGLAIIVAVAALPWVEERLARERTGRVD